MTLAELADTLTVVVDDGSNPATTFERQTHRQLIRRSAPGGPGVARNDGLREVTTPVTLFIDAGSVSQLLRSEL